MNDQLDARLAQSLHARLDVLDIPPVDLDRIAARPAQRRTRRLGWYTAPLAACAAFAVIVFAMNGSVKALTATVHDSLARQQGMILARLLGLKRPVHVTITKDITYKRTTLAQARRDLPFAVITPAWLPAGFRLSSVETGSDRSLSLTYVPVHPKGAMSKSAIAVAESVARPGQRPRETSGGIIAHFRPNGTLTDVHRSDPSRFVSSNFSVGRTHVTADILDVPNAHAVVRRMKASMQTPLRN